VGEVTSGTISPILEKTIGMALVDASAFAQVSTGQASLEWEDRRGRRYPIQIVKRPFYPVK
jgi:aminomethyltransferase